MDTPTDNNKSSPQSDNNNNSPQNIYPYQLEQQKLGLQDDDKKSQISQNQNDHQIQLQEVDLMRQTSNSFKSQVTPIPAQNMQVGIPMQTNNGQTQNAELAIFAHDLKRYTDSQVFFRRVTLLFLVFCVLNMIGTIAITEKVYYGLPHLMSFLNWMMCFIAIRETRTAIEQNQFPLLNKTIKLIKYSYIPQILTYVLMLVMDFTYYKMRRRGKGGKDGEDSDSDYEDDEDYEDDDDHHDDDDYHRRTMRRFLFRMLDKADGGSKDGKKKGGKDKHDDDDDEKIAKSMRLLGAFLFGLFILEIYMLFYKRRQIKNARNIIETSSKFSQEQLGQLTYVQNNNNNGNTNQNPMDIDGQQQQNYQQMQVWQDDASPQN